MINITKLHVQYDKHVALQDVSFHIAEEKITTIIGPNGCGKSTLLKAMSKNLKYQKGRIEIGGKNLSHYSPKKLAKSLAILPQNPKVPADFTVHELVSFGRYPFISFGKRMKQKDYDMMAWALDKTDMTTMKGRMVSTLSGGERQRAWIAMALAQEPRILLLDEPTTYLDIAHQFDVLELIKSIQEKTGITIVMVLHDINQAARYSHDIVVMKKGAIVKQGSPKDIINEDTMEGVFRLKGNFIKGSRYPHFIPLESKRQA
ncbi:ABC transporter ATP-binding protein [Vallitalea pronyensis]|uniref:ABC transporter ATP-binding protein n=1 Tax=Vallitalea pronyensis TaxID=1348613 RepID=A0A8J8MHT3_9FIRM|nr:ABC transporter ATP-binding protein [Vallitalea pronyensis]QUI21786.1 ABC transporter ATP-binding protein [Vallitalea pronyensis]